MRPKQILTVSLLVSTICRAQEVSDTMVSEFYSKFDIHAAAGIVSGVRLGARVRTGEHFSFEGSYGADYTNFIGLSDIDTRFAYGVNWHKGGSSNFVISLVGAYARRPFLSENYSHFVSSNVGLLPLSGRGLRTSVRFGFFVEFEHKYSGTTNNFGINLDLGLGWVFP